MINNSNKKVSIIICCRVPPGAKRRRWTRAFTLQWKRRQLRITLWWVDFLHLLLSVGLFAQGNSIFTCPTHCSSVYFHLTHLGKKGRRNKKREKEMMTVIYTSIGLFTFLLRQKMRLSWLAVKANKNRRRAFPLFMEFRLFNYSRRSIDRTIVYRCQSKSPQTVDRLMVCGTRPIVSVGWRVVPFPSPTAKYFSFSSPHVTSRPVKTTTADAGRPGPSLKDSKNFALMGGESS